MCGERCEERVGRAGQGGGIGWWHAWAGPHYLQCHLVSRYGCNQQTCLSFARSLVLRVCTLCHLAGEGVLDAVTTIAQDVVDQRLLVWRLQQAQQQAQQTQQAQQQAQQQGGRRSPWASLHSGSLAPQQAQQQAQQAQRGRSRSADSYVGQLPAAEAGLPSSRGRAVRRSAGSSSSMRSASAGQAGREYVVRGSELGSPPRRGEEPSCVIC